MEKTKEQAAVIQALYEISLSIGGSLDLDIMLDDSLNRIMSIANFCEAYVFSFDTHGNLILEPSKSIPARIKTNPDYSDFTSHNLKNITISNASTHLPRYSHYRRSGRNYYAYHLESFGVLVLGNLYAKNNKQFFMGLIPVMNKLGQAANTCLYEKELKSKMREAQEASRAKTAFLANIGHELRTPLNAIINLAARNITELKMNQIQENMKIIKTSSDYLLEIINNLLHVAKATSGLSNRIPLAPKPRRIVDLISAITQMHLIEAERKGIHIYVEAEYDTAIYVMVDPVQFNRIFTNLITNAVKFTDRGYVKITITIDEEFDHSIRFLFTIEDTGIGMWQSDVKKVFEPFHQVDTSLSKNQGGTGLGLSIVKSSIETLDGDLDVMSTPNEGTTFAIKLEFERAVDCIEEPGTTDIDTIIYSLVHKKLRVLVVEDNEINRYVFQSMLNAISPSKVDMAHDGNDCINLFSLNNYDVILMDIMMPGVDGFEATQRIRKIEEIDGRQRTPILAITAYQTDFDGADTVGFDAIIKKPVNATELYASLDDSTKGKSAAEDKKSLPCCEVNFTIDRSAIAKSFNISESSLMSMMKMLLVRLPDQYKAISQAVKECKVDLAHKKIHNLKGHASTFLHSPLANLCQEIEDDIATTKSTEMAMGELHRLEAYIKELECGLERAMKSDSCSPALPRQKE